MNARTAALIAPCLALAATVGRRRYVTGHLFAGSASCQQLDASDFFGRFDKAYPALRPWLGSVPGAPG